MASVWNEEIKHPQFGRLSKDIKTDVLIIGGGIAGILCAYELKSQGIDCVIVEAAEICSGNTKNTTAKITCQHGLIYDKMLKRFGQETVKLYIDAQCEALQRYKNMSKNIDCDFLECDSFVYSISDRQKIEDEVKALQKAGISADFLTETSLPFKVSGAVRIKNQAQFNPLKFLYTIAKDLNIYEKTQVLKIEKGVAVTNKGKIKAEKIIVATHFPFINKYGGYFLKMYQHRSYVLALKSTPPLNGMYVDEDEKGLSFRNYNEFLLLGGGSHRTGKDGGCWQELSDFAQKFYPDSHEEYRWSAQDCMTLDDIPYIGEYSPKTPYLYVVSGFNKWGMTSAMAGASILSDLVQGKENKYSEVFSPSRSILRSQLMVNVADSVMGLLRPTVPRCPHLGCALVFNKQEHSWDCPCHGSRFTKEGKLIDNPAQKNAKTE